MGDKVIKDAKIRILNSHIMIIKIIEISQIQWAVQILVFHIVACCQFFTLKLIQRIRKHWAIACLHFSIDRFGPFCVDFFMSSPVG